MKELRNWFNEKLATPYFTAVDYLKEITWGAAQIFNPRLLKAVIRSERTQVLLKQSAYDNARYLLPILAAEKSKELLVSYVDEDRAASFSYWADYLVLLCSVQLFLNALLDNALLNAAIVKTVIDENPNPENQHSCDCDENKKARGSIASLIYPAGNLMAIYSISRIVPSSFGVYLGASLRMLSQGQMMMEYKLNAGGHCTSHRHALLSKNYLACLGLGAASFWLAESLSKSLEYAAGVPRNYFITDGIWNVLMPYYLIQVLLIDRPLNGQRRGIDVFRYVRLSMEFLLKDLANIFFPSSELVQKQGAAKQSHLEAWLQELNHSLLFKAIKMIFLKQEMRSLADLGKKTSVALCLDVLGNNIRSYLKLLVSIRENKLAINVLALSEFLPAFLMTQKLSDLKKILSLLLAENTGEILSLITRFYGDLETNSLRHVIHDPVPLKAMSQAEYSMKNTSMKDTPAFIENYLPNDSEEYSTHAEQSLAQTDDSDPLSESWCVLSPVERKKSALQIQGFFSPSSSGLPEKSNDLNFSVEWKRKYK